MSSDGCSPGRQKIPWDDLEEEFHRVASLDEVDGTPSCRDMDEYGKYTHYTYLDRFDGRWDKAVIYYGYEPHNPHAPRISDEQLEADFHEFAAELDEDRGPTQIEMTEDGPHAHETYCRRLGVGWTGVLEHYGYEPNKAVFVHGTKDIEEIMHRIAIETKRPPEPEDVPEDVREDILKRFGSWWVAQEMFGVTKRDLDAFFDEGDES